MTAIPKSLIVIGSLLLIIGIIFAIVPVTVSKDFSASEFSLYGNEYVAPSVNLPPGVVVTVKWETDSWQLFGTPSCALAMKDSNGNYNVLASGEGKSGSFTYTTMTSGDYYILQRGMTVFTSGTVTLSYTLFPYLILGVFMLIVGILIAGIGGVLNRRAKKVTVVYTQAPPIQQPPVRNQPKYHPQPQQPISPPPMQPVMGPPLQGQYQAPPQPMMPAQTIEPVPTKAQEPVTPQVLTELPTPVVPSTSPSPQEPITAPQPAHTAPAAFCGKCGKPLGPEDMFCPSCGTPRQ